MATDADYWEALEEVRRLQEELLRLEWADPVRLLRDQGIEPDDWQAALLRDPPHRGLVLAARQVGKSLTIGTMAAHRAIAQPGAVIVIASPTLRQSSELLRKVRSVLPASIDLTSHQVTSMQLANGSRVIAVPGDSPRGIRGLTVDLLLIDEAAFISDELVQVASPMLAVSKGDLVAATTAGGCAGPFYEWWISDDPWHRVTVPASQCLRLTPEYLQAERRRLGTQRFEQEFECRFTKASDALFTAEEIRALSTSAGTHHDQVVPILSLEQIMEGVA